MALDPAYPTGPTQLDTTEQWEAFFAGYGGDGVIAGVRLEMAPYFDVGTRTAGVAPGAAQIRGVHVTGPTHTSKPIPVPSAQDRIDRVVLRLDRAAATAADWVTVQVLTGTPGTSPSPPALTQTDDGVYEIPMARWTSEASGALSGFADERVIAAAADVEFSPWARPPASPRRLGFERFTNKVMWADGTVWQTVYEDTGWATLGLNGRDAIAWSVDTPMRYRRLNGVVYLHMEVSRWRDNPLRLSDDNGSTPYVLPAGFRPAELMLGHGNHARNALQLFIYPGGDIRIYPLNQDLAAGRRIYATAQFPIG